MNTWSLPVAVYQLDIAAYASAETTGSGPGILNSFQEDLET